MKRRIATFFISSLLGLFAAVPAPAEPTQADLEELAAAMAAQFSTICPRARQTNVGMRKEIAPELRAAILQTGEVFRNALNAADQWEAGRHPADH
jgi:hypothetical protein